MRRRRLRIGLSNVTDNHRGDNWDLPDLRLAAEQLHPGVSEGSTVHTVEWTTFSCRALFLQVCLQSNKVGLEVAPAKVQTCT